MKRTMPYTPLWVEVVYRAAEWVDRFLSKLSGKFYWRYTFLDDHCWCIRCEERRRAGIQRPRKKGLFP